MFLLISYYRNQVQWFLCDTLFLQTVAEVFLPQNLIKGSCIFIINVILEIINENQEKQMRGNTTICTIYQKKVTNVSKENATFFVFNINLKN